MCVLNVTHRSKLSLFGRKIKLKHAIYVRNTYTIFRISEKGETKKTEKAYIFCRRENSATIMDSEKRHNKKI